MRIQDEMANGFGEMLDIAQSTVEADAKARTVRREMFAFKLTSEFQHIDSGLDECEEDFELAFEENSAA